MFHRSNSALGIVSKLSLLSLLNYFPFGFGALLQPSGFDFSCEKKTEGKGELKARNLSALLWNTLFSTENCGRLPQKNCQIAQRYLPCSPLSNFARKSVSRWWWQNNNSTYVIMYSFIAHSNIFVIFAPLFTITSF